MRTERERDDFVFFLHLQRCRRPFDDGTGMFYENENDLVSEKQRSSIVDGAGRAKK
jgi:hypothetical protein